MGCLCSWLVVLLVTLCLAACLCSAGVVILLGIGLLLICSRVCNGFDTLGLI